jgi:hypothetical protein
LLTFVNLFILPETCISDAVPFGIENGRISDSQITSSSVWSAALSTQQARLNDAASWTARQRDQNQWIQVDLGKEEVVTVIATQGRSNADQWVKAYSVSYSSDGQSFDYYKVKGTVMVRPSSTVISRNRVLQRNFTPLV